jgi:hypothetical protein
MLEMVESLRGKEAEKAGNLRAFLTKMCESLPRIIEIVERTIKEIGAI